MKNSTRKLLLFVCALIVVGAKAQVIPNIDWIKYFSQKPNKASSGTTIDANNNVYITGNNFNGTDKDMVVIKYDSLGTLLWWHVYDNGGDDIGTAIKVDPLGVVYITGVSYDATSGNDYLTRCYDPAGNLLWSERFDGNGGNGDDQPVDLIIDYPNSVIYVTGTSYGGSSTKDITTLAYKLSGGSPTMKVDYNGPTGGDDFAKAMVASSNGNYIYITGSEAGSTSDDVTTICLDNTGTLIWNTAYDGTSASSDCGNAITLSGANVVITGVVNNSSTSTDYTTAKYDGATGSVIWQTDYDYNSDINEASGIVKDTVGNIAVVGIALDGSGNYEYHTVLYDSTGTQLWVNAEITNLASLSVQPKIGMDTVANFFYVSGEIQNASVDIQIYQIDPTNAGVTSWKRTVDGAVNGQDAGVNLTLSGWGTIYLLANTENGAGFYDLTTIKISQTPLYSPPNFNGIQDTVPSYHYFYPNVGEVRNFSNTPVPDVLYSSKHTYPQEFIWKNNDLTFLFAKMDTSKSNIPPLDSIFRVDLEFFHNNPLTNAFAFNYNTDAVINYFLSYISSTPITNVRGASNIMIPNIYPLIDLHFTSDKGAKGLKLYFVVKPGGNPNDILLNWHGPTSTTITGTNDLFVHTPLGDLDFLRPQVYNVALSGSSIVTYTSGGSSWNHVSGSMYSINTGTYVSSLPLIIQINQGAIATLTTTPDVGHSTYFGGSGNDIIRNSKIDNSAFNYICGTSSSPNLPLNTAWGAPFAGANQGNRDGFISKLRESLYFTTYLGGDRVDDCLDIEVDVNNGDAYVVGITTSSVFPTHTVSGAYNNTVFVGPVTGTALPGLDKDDGFIFQTDLNGTTNKWSAFYGGNDFDYVSDIRFDATGNIFVVGSSVSSNIPVVASGGQYSQAYNTAQQAQDPTNGRVYDAIIMKFAVTTHSLMWATYYGTDLNTGTTNISDDDFTDLDFDASGNVYVAGRTGGINLPNKINNHYNTANNTDGIIVKFNNNGNIISAKHTQGNTRNNAIKIDNSKVYVCGMNTNTIATVNSGNYYYVSTRGGSFAYDEADYMVFDQSLNTIHASYIGGNLDDRATDLQFDNNGIFYICGGSASTNFTVVTPPNTYSSNNMGGYDYFIMALKEGHTGPLWSTQLGTYGVESNFGNDATMSIYPYYFGGRLWLAGVTTSTAGYLIQYPTTGGYVVPTSAGGQDGSYTRFDISSVRAESIFENKFDKTTFEVYPNPTNSYLFIDNELLNNKETIYNVYDMLGQKVATGMLDKDGIKSVNVSHLLPGTYIINFNTKYKNYNTKFVKTN